MKLQPQGSSPDLGDRVPQVRGGGDPKEEVGETLILQNSSQDVWTYQKGDSRWM